MRMVPKEDEVKAITGFGVFEDLVRSLHKHPTNRNERLGQTYLNVLSKIRPDIADQIRGTLFDPSDRHTIHPKVSDRVRTLWGNNN